MTKALKTLVTGSLKASIATALLLGDVSAANAQECDDPEALRFSMIPTEETTQELTLYEPMVERLSEITGKKIEFYLPTSYASVIEAMLSGWVDIGMHGPYSYVIAKEKDPTLDVFATYAKHEGHFQKEGAGYQGILVTRADSGLDSIEKLEGTVLGLTDPASTSGNLLPRVAFTDVIGKDLEDYFSKVVYTGGHDLSSIAVKEGKVDAAFVATHRIDNVIDRDLATMDEYQVLWESPVIPQDPFVYRGNLCPELKEKIAEAFLGLHESERGRTYLENVNASRFVKMTDADYDIIRALKKAKDSASN
ncbi:MAG: phosphate/phosphite/phosphonate ABC transporter substrate-binding protein [Rhodovibrionaceae bacterium]